MACHKGTIGSTNNDYAANDSIALEKVKYSIIQYCDRKHPCEEQMEPTQVFVRQQSALCDRLFEISFNDVEYTLCKIMHSEDMKNCKVSDFVQFRTCEMPILCSLEIEKCRFCAV